jgi:UTP-glucose-1-phosphate uridylyltransferase/mevalonate kinase
MENKKLMQIAQDGGFFSYVGGVDSYINDNYKIGGVKIVVTKMDLPMKSGLSSSAAICVLVARAFNCLYNLKMNTKGEMQAAFRGEQRTPSRCGRLDQACAYGIKPVVMSFDGIEMDSHELKVGASFTWVVADLMASKDTIKILADLNKSFPFAESEQDKAVQEALGKDNHYFVTKAIEYIEAGDRKKLGQLMNQTQKNFDRKVMPASSELIAPVLHEILNDEKVGKLVLGGKGVGSQGDGTVQFLVDDIDKGIKLQSYLQDKKGMPSFMLTIHPGQIVKKAIIPLAGFGTRVFPATKCMKKCFLPILDKDGMLKPALLIMIEQLLEAGIEDICLVIGEDDKDDFDSFFADLPNDNFSKLPENKKQIQREISRIASKITYVYQKERLGFGHAVWLCREFAGNEPVLLMLGDFLYQSATEKNCCKQVIDAFMECGKCLVSIAEIPLSEVVHYGCLAGQWEDTDETIMRVSSMVEKPTDDYAEGYLGVLNSKKEKKFYATFGQYVLTPDVFEALDDLIRAEKKGEEYQLTDALTMVMENNGMFAFKPAGECFDIGLPERYRETMIHFCNSVYVSEKIV